MFFNHHHHIRWNMFSYICTANWKTMARKIVERVVLIKSSLKNVKNSRYVVKTNTKMPASFQIVLVSVINIILCWHSPSVFFKLESVFFLSTGVTHVYLYKKKIKKIEKNEEVKLLPRWYFCSCLILIIPDIF